ncbi:hypothetical protein AMJ80_07000 [bacterium SM23_31]|nr:MAG: hypothetical protein AMJ80_07000 [bacterium SM23_31]
MRLIEIVQNTNLTVKNVKIFILNVKKKIVFEQNILRNPTFFPGWVINFIFPVDFVYLYAYM